METKSIQNQRYYNYLKRAAQDRENRHDDLKQQYDNRLDEIQSRNDLHRRKDENLYSSKLDAMREGTMKEIEQNNLRSAMRMESERADFSKYRNELEGKHSREMDSLAQEYRSRMKESDNHLDASREEFMKRFANERQELLDRHSKEKGKLLSEHTKEKRAYTNHLSNQYDEIREDANMQKLTVQNQAEDRVNTILKQSDDKITRLQESHDSSSGAVRERYEETVKNLKNRYDKDARYHAEQFEKRLREKDKLLAREGAGPNSLRTQQFEQMKEDYENRLDHKFERQTEVQEGKVRDLNDHLKKVKDKSSEMYDAQRERFSRAMEKQQEYDTTERREFVRDHQRKVSNLTRNYYLNKDAMEDLHEKQKINLLENTASTVRKVKNRSAMGLRDAEDHYKETLAIQRENASEEKFQIEVKSREETSEALKEAKKVFDLKNQNIVDGYEKRLSDTQIKIDDLKYNMSEQVKRLEEKSKQQIKMAQRVAENEKEQAVIQEREKGREQVNQLKSSINHLHKTFEKQLRAQKRMDSQKVKEMNQKLDFEIAQLKEEHKKAVDDVKHKKETKAKSVEIAHLGERDQIISTYEDKLRVLEEREELQKQKLAHITKRQSNLA